MDKDGGGPALGPGGEGAAWYEDLNTALGREKRMGIMGISKRNSTISGR